METHGRNIRLRTDHRRNPGQCRQFHPPPEFPHVVVAAAGAGSNLNTESECMKTLRCINKGRWLGLFLALSASSSSIAQTSNVPASAPSFTTATNAATTTTSAPPPSAGAKRSAADLDKLVAPIALYPDPLLA